MGVELRSVKRKFSSLMGDVRPAIKSQFVIWLDEKVAEFKVNGLMALDDRMDAPKWIKDYSLSVIAAGMLFSTPDEPDDTQEEERSPSPRDPGYKQADNGTQDQEEADDDFEIVEIKQEEMDDDIMCIESESTPPTFHQYSSHRNVMPSSMSNIHHRTSPISSSRRSLPTKLRSPQPHTSSSQNIESVHNDRVTFPDFMPPVSSILPIADSMPSTSKIEPDDNMYDTSLGGEDADLSGTSQEECSDCGKHFFHKVDLANHKKCHMKDVSIICDECGKGFRSNGALYNHRKTMHEKERFSCIKCPETFGRRETLKRHVTNLHGDAQQTCETCGQKYKNLQEHVTRCHAVPSTRFKCHVCPSTFKENRYLREHILYAHINPGRYECQGCSEKFGHRKLFINHKKVCPR